MRVGLREAAKDFAVSGLIAQGWPKMLRRSKGKRSIHVPWPILLPGLVFIIFTTFRGPR